MAVADIVKTTLGPKGMDKILQSMSGQGGIQITNDGATILKSIPIDNAAAKIIVDTSITQDQEVGDGTTSVAVFAGELLHQAQELIDKKIHPQTIIRGWRKAVVVAREALLASSKDNSDDQEKFRTDLVNVAMTTLSSKILNVDKKYFAELAVDAVLRLKGSVDLSSIQIIQVLGGKLRDSYLEEGFILNKSIGIGQPKRLENAKIMIANTSMDTDKIKIYNARVRTSSMNTVADIEKAEKDRMKAKVEKICEHDINVFINRQLIYNYPEQLFAQAGVLSIEHADFDGIERLALVTGAEITSTFEHPEMVTLGKCDLIEEITIGEQNLIRFAGVPKGEACTVVLRGASHHILAEAERSLHDALCILSQMTRSTRTVLGGGCSEMIMAKAVDEIGKKTPGKESLAIEAFARALRQIPAIIAENGGYDSSDLVSKLRAAHYQNKNTAGLDMDRGIVGDMVDLKITEAFKCKSQVVISGHEAAEMILRVDDIIRTAPRQRQG